MRALAEHSVTSLDVVHHADALALLRALPDGYVNCIVTSPPFYGLRDYGADGQIGLEDTPEQYVARLVELFREARRVLRDDGTLWLNLGDSYNGTGGGHTKEAMGKAAYGVGDYPRNGRNTETLKPKDLIGIPWRVAFALQADGWWLRSDIIWAKKNCMPESVTDRPTKSHEYVFLLTKAERYWYDADAIREPVSDVSLNRARYGWHSDHPGTRSNGGIDIAQMGSRFVDPAGRNRRTVWTVPTEPSSVRIKTDRLYRVVPGDVSDGMMHIVSPSCPMHGGLFAHLCMDFCGEYVTDELSHILRNDVDRAQELIDAVGSSAHIDSRLASLDSWDYSRLSRFRSAILHSIETNRKDRDLVTNLAYMPFAETVSRTENKLMLLASFLLHDYTRENNILPDEMDARLSDRIPCRTADTFSLVHSPDCTCQFYQKVTEKTSHFAMFPQALIEPMVLAGCPAQVCAVCGAPYERVVDYAPNYEKRQARGAPDGVMPQVDSSGWRPPKRESLGFAPTCSCDTNDTRPGIVYDPFMGSGTTALVAQRLGRHFIGTDINREYVELARRRLHYHGDDSRMVKEQEAGVMQRTLFDAPEAHDSTDAEQLALFQQEASV